MEAPAPDWSELPADVLGSVLRLLECPDLLRSAAVCTAWHKCSSTVTVCADSQTPCLLYCTEAAASSALGMYSLSERKAYTLSIPEPPIAGRFWYGSSHGWLVTADTKSDLILLNPITAEQIALPPVTTMEHIDPVMDDNGVHQEYKMGCYSPRLDEPPFTYRLDEYGEEGYAKAALSSDPSAGDCTVMVIHRPLWQLSFAKVGGDSWNWITVDFNYTDCIYHEGWFYAVNTEGSIDSFNLSGPSIIHKRIVHKILPSSEMVVYIAKAPWGDILLIVRESDALDPDQEDLLSTTEILVYKVDTEEKKLIKMEGIGDHVLFIGHNSSLCLSVKDHPTLMSNCVYFTDNEPESLSLCKSTRRDTGVYHLENNTVTNIVSPELWMSWLPPMWFTPNISKISCHTGQCSDQ